MRYLFAAGLRAASIAVIIGCPIPASAQSFLQNLFGLGQPPAPADRSLGRPGAPAYSNPVRPEATWSREIRRYSPAASEDMRSDASEDHAQSPSGGGKYRTLCVRSCDGYYFPIGNAVTRNRFMRDAAQCRASCGEEARLFYLPAGSDNVSTMLDLSGRSYVRMPTAFKYRKSLTDGCTCRPMPWSAAEQQRHQRYAEEAARVAAEAEAKRLADEAADAQRTSVAGRSNSGSRPGKAGERTVTVQTAAATEAKLATAAANAPQAAAESEGGDIREADPSVAADTSAPKPSGRIERSRQIAVTQAAAQRGVERMPPGRRQQAVARASVPQGGGSSWFSPSSAKYTWPGDPPRR